MVAVPFLIEYYSGILIGVVPGVLGKCVPIYLQVTLRKAHARVCLGEP